MQTEPRLSLKDLSASTAAAPAQIITEFSENLKAMSPHAALFRHSPSTNVRQSVLSHSGTLGEIDRLRCTLEKQQLNQNTTIDMMQQEMRTIREAHALQLAAKNQEISHLRRKCDEMQAVAARVGQLEQHLEDATREKHVLQSRIRCGNSAAATESKVSQDGELSRLSHLLDLRESDIQILQSQRDDLQRVLKAQESQFQSETSHLRSLHDRVVEAKQRELTDVRSLYEARLQNFTHLASDTRDNFANALSERDSQISKLQNQLAVQKQKHDRITREVEQECLLQIQTAHAAGRKEGQAAAVETLHLQQQRSREEQNASFQEHLNAKERDRLANEEQHSAYIQTMQADVARLLELHTLKAREQTAALEKLQRDNQQLTSRLQQQRREFDSQLSSHQETVQKLQKKLDMV
eukprot:TRINITY_DN2524_c0_g1_i1.p1 TRINITY_DN2524_c0_g1~~TRINITY_DN2524_c0_g1_i1.p1  ORF type:complete len:409 (+),score=73.77 TRINITY_DN2524_c0_g1_i1:293-1519(+)